jgi:hypothetical protein
MISINLTKRDRKRTLRSGIVITQTRYVVNYREPRTGKRRQLFFERHKMLKRSAARSRVKFRMAPIAIRGRRSLSETPLAAG